MTEQPPLGPPPGSYPPPPPPEGYPPPPPPSAGGYPPPQGQFAGAPTGTNRLAIASLVCSVVGLLCGIIGPVVGIVLGVIALNQIKQTGQAGRGLALAGIILGAVLLALGVISLILYFGMSGTSSYS